MRRNRTFELLNQVSRDWPDEETTLNVYVVTIDGGDADGRVVGAAVGDFGTKGEADAIAAACDGTDFAPVRVADGWVVVQREFAILHHVSTTLMSVNVPQRA